MATVRAVGNPLTARVAELERGNLRLLALVDLGQRLAAERDPGRLLERCCDAARELIGASVAAVVIRDDQGGAPRRVVVSGLDEASAAGTGFAPAAEVVVAELVAARRAVRRSHRPGEVPGGARSSLGVPVLSPVRAYGGLYLVDKLGEDEFSEEDERLGVTVAAQLAVTYENARRCEDVERLAAVLERQVAERTARLQQATAELDTFAYSVSHDLRAPLRALQGLSGVLLEDYADRLDEVGRDYLRRIGLSAERMDTQIQDVLAYTRLLRAALTLRSVALDRVVEAARARLAAELEARGAELHVDGPLPAVVGHADTLVLVVASLLSNAAKFVAPGQRPAIRVGADTAGAAVRLRVEDDGIGVAPEHHERIFGVFERLHGIESYPGNGIGLSLVRKGVERMGGRVGVESQLGRGSRFWIELPLAEGGS
jgi:signal transduction histidine kinase